MLLIEHNPYRILGTYADSPVKNRVANQAKMKAFLKVGKPVSFPVDFPGFLLSVERNEENVAQAVNALALLDDRVRYAQFWFVNSSTIDEAAFKCMTEGRVNDAVRIWRTRETASSLQNRIVVELVRRDLREVADLARKLYEEHLDEFLELLSASEYVGKEKLGSQFFEAIVQAGNQGEFYGIDVESILMHSSGAFAEDLKEKRSQAILKELSRLIEDLEENSKDDVSADTCYEETEKFIESVKKLLPELEENLDSQRYVYETWADRCARAIRNATVHYHNKGDARRYVYGARRHLIEAMAIAVNENFDDDKKHLDEVIENFLPEYLEAKNNKIQERLAAHLTGYSVKNGVQILRDFKEFHDQCEIEGCGNNPTLAENRRLMIEVLIGHALACFIAFSGGKAVLKPVRATPQNWQDFIEGSEALLELVDYIAKPRETFKGYNDLKMVLDRVKSKNKKTNWWPIVIFIILAFIIFSQ